VRGGAVSGLAGGSIVPFSGGGVPFGGGGRSLVPAPGGVRGARLFHIVVVVSHDHILVV
jgi:hypothetical protein